MSQPVIIATKGLPYTCKSVFARIIGQWVKCPVFYIDQFLDTLSLEKGYTSESPPSVEEAERLHRLAFVALCKAASDSLQWGVDIYYWPYKCIVVKSHLDSTFELERLLQLAKKRGCGMILIIEFQMKNEYRYRLRLEDKMKSLGHNEWYKSRSWNDIEKAKGDYEVAHDNWDLHLRRLVESHGDGLPRVTRLVLDPFDDLFLGPSASLPTSCQHIINFFLDREDSFVKGRYLTLQYREVGRYWREKKLSGLRSNDERICYASGHFLCTFKYSKELDFKRDYYCGVCEGRVTSGQPAYGCQFCTLTLHKSCAELPLNDEFEGYQHIEILRDYPEFLPQQHPCKSCLEGGMPILHGCNSCKLETHLKCRVLPTILTHDCHDHFLFMCFDSV